MAEQLDNMAELNNSNNNSNNNADVGNNNNNSMDVDATGMNGVGGNLVDQLQRAATARNNGTDIGGPGGQEDQVAELAEVLRGFESTILGVASSVGSAREGVTSLQLGEFLGNGSRTRR